MRDLRLAPYTGYLEQIVQLPECRFWDPVNRPSGYDSISFLCSLASGKMVIENLCGGLAEPNPDDLFCSAGCRKVNFLLPVTIRSSFFQASKLPAACLLIAISIYAFSDQ